MKNSFIKISALAFCGLLSASVHAQDTVRYTGTTLSNVDYHHGQLAPAIGVHNIQVMRANREFPEKSDGFGWTYNHAPMIAYWNGTFYVQYLSNPVGEHVPPGQTLLLTSKDGYNWSKPEVAFGLYKIPDGTTKEGIKTVAKDLYAVNHQRMGFFVSKKSRLLTLAFYGTVLEKGDDPNDGNGIGRVVREIYKDGKMGPVYFIRYNHGWNAKNTAHPFYTSSKDKGFVEACNELLANPLITQQWNEEADRNDPLIPLKKDYKAFSFYHLPDGRVVGLWKNALTAISTDNGKSWPANAVRAPRFVNSNAKIWGQRLSNGMYATVYNPSEFRWPLAVSTSPDGLNYTNLLLVNGEITSMRYGGAYKSYGPQYVRGIVEGNGTPPDGNMWVTYSMNKEDIWVSKIPVPVTEKATSQADDVFQNIKDGDELKLWNVYSPLWAPVTIEKMADGVKALTMSDWDPFDYGKAERVIPAAKRSSAEFSITPAQNDKGQLDIEFQNAKGNAAIRLSFDSTGTLISKAGYRNRGVAPYKAGEEYKIKVEWNVDTRFYTISVNGKTPSNNIMFAPAESIERIVFRTGGVRRFPDADTPTDQIYDLPNGGFSAPKATFYIKSLKTGSEYLANANKQ
ncbi:exo-alpha-sialidase [Chitinophagaceae bacterium LB-8]|uniref:Exo-alpha-sialidase n=1 Tax=Paraflavisolibacter caeni TaxID=2982496 RepID=A0A9X3BIT2_9BACT|nr:six-hairpin glycosidase [Paraflavisolibacter caeni]MCU7551902.1 exo-alpha-sialidase [Paraflavisolibacter caeni]